MCNGGFGPLSLVAGNVFVEVGQPAGHRLCDVTQLIPRYSVALQVVCQGALAAHADTAFRSTDRGTKIQRQSSATRVNGS